MNIVGLGPKIVDQLLLLNMIGDPGDLYALKKDDLMKLSNFKDKKAEKIIDAIDDSKKISLARFIYSLGIRNIGEETARDLANHFIKLEDIRKAEKETLETINGIGPTVSKAVYEWFNNLENKRIVDRLINCGINIVSPLVAEKVGEKQHLKGITFVFTGELSSMTREEAKEKILKLGGRVLLSVNKSLNYLVCGENPGSKLKDAQKNHISIVNEFEFLAMINK